jgi:hypothetical protein
VVGFGGPELELVWRGAESRDVVPRPAPRSVFRGREVVESRVRTALIVIAAPSFDQRGRLGEIVEPMEVQAFKSQRPVKVSMKALSVGLPRRE